jgi:hypothetical protein
MIDVDARDRPVGRPRSTVCRASRPSGNARTSRKPPECVQAAPAEGRVHGGFDETAELWHNSPQGLALTVLLYLGGESHAVRAVHPGKKPIKQSLRRRDAERFTRGGTQPADGDDTVVRESNGIQG